MAGHVRSVATGKARRTASGRIRKVREHLPPGEAEQAKRRKQHLGARTVATDQINRAGDLLRKLDIARQYVRSAAAKYTAAPDEINAAVEALLALGDRIYANGVPLSPGAKRTRRANAARHRQQRQQTALLIQEGRASIRRQQNDAQRTS